MATDWPFVIIDDHEGEARSRPTSLYQNNVDIQNIIRVKAERTQIIEDAIWSVVTEKWIGDAEGQQLNELGAIVGEPRLGRSDEEYIEAIGIRIRLNSGGGSPELILTYLRFVFQTENVRIEEIFPASFKVFAGVDVTLEQAQALRRLVGAGIGTIFVSFIGEGIPFGHSEFGFPPPPDVLGFGELGLHALELSDGDLLELSDGFILGVNDSTDQVLPTEGGQLAELYGV